MPWLRFRWVDPVPCRILVHRFHLRRRGHARDVPGFVSRRTTSPYHLPWAVGMSFKVGQGSCTGAADSHAAGSILRFRSRAPCPIQAASSKTSPTPRSNDYRDMASIPARDRHSRA